MNLYLPLFLTILLALQCIGCGGCQTTQRAWDQALQGQQQYRSGPHWILEVDADEIEKQLNVAKNKVNKRPPKLKLPSSLPQLKLDAISFKIKGLSWVVDQEEGHLKVLVSVLMRDKEVTTLSLRGDSPIDLNHEERLIRLTVRADQFKKASLRLGKKSERAIRDALRSYIPRRLRRLVPESQIVKFAQKVLRRVSEQGYPLIRKQLLTPLGKLASFEWQLPDYPIDRLMLRATDKVWRIGLWTTLKADGLGEEAMMKGVRRPAEYASTKGVRKGVRKKSHGEESMGRLVISAPWLAAAGNWAMEEGKLPSRFDRAGKPDEQGEARAAMTWQSTDLKHPLKVHLHADQEGGAPICLYARVGLDPQLEVKSSKLSMKAKGKIERVEGNVLVKTAVHLSGIGTRAFKWHHRAAASMKVKMGRTTIPLVWQSTQLTPSYLFVTVNVDKTKGKVSLLDPMPAFALLQPPQQYDHSVGVLKCY